MKKKFTTNLVVEIAIFSSIALALDFLQSGLWRGVFLNGGSIGLAMIPVVVIAYRRGFVASLITGTIVALMQMLGGIYVISNTWYNTMLQIGFDYIFAYPIVALCGLFYKAFKNAETNKQKAKYLIYGTVLGGFGKFLMHFIAGIWFWQNFEFKGGFVLYSLIYNGGYMFPNIIICSIIVVLLLYKAPIIYKVDKENQNEENPV